MTNGGETQAYGLGKVKTTINEEDLSITNETTEDHLLHPGTVNRQIRQIGDDVVVVTEGKGKGLFPGLNNVFAPFVWSGPDGNLRHQFKTNPRLAPQGSTNAEPFKINRPKDATSSVDDRDD